MKVIPTLPEYVQYSTTLLHSQVCKNTFLKKKYAAIAGIGYRQAFSQTFFIEIRLSHLQEQQKRSEAITTSDHKGQSSHRQQPYCLESSADKQGQRLSCLQEMLLKHHFCQSKRLIST